MSGCDYCEETLLRSEPVRCYGCECIYHDYCAEATGWGSTPEGEWLCEECVKPGACGCVQNVGACDSCRAHGWRPA